MLEKRFLLFILWLPSIMCLSVVLGSFSSVKIRVTAPCITNKNGHFVAILKIATATLYPFCIALIMAFGYFVSIFTTHAVHSEQNCHFVSIFTFFIIFAFLNAWKAVFDFHSLAPEHNVSVCSDWVLQIDF